MELVWGFRLNPKAMNFIALENRTDYDLNPHSIGLPVIYF